MLALRERPRTGAGRRPTPIHAATDEAGRGRLGRRDRRRRRRRRDSACGWPTAPAPTPLRVEIAAGARGGADPLAGRPRRGRAGHLTRPTGSPSPTATARPSAQARAELGYVDFLRARYDRAERWLDQVLARAERDSPSARAKAMTYLGSVASDRGDYPQASALLEGGPGLPRRGRAPARGLRPVDARPGQPAPRRPRRRGDQLDAAVDLAERDHWLSFLPWPQALLGQVALARATSPGAAELPGAVLRPGLSDRRPVLGGHLGPRAGPGRRGRGRRRPGLRRPARRPRPHQPARRPLRLARRHILDALCEIGVATGTR